MQLERSARKSLWRQAMPGHQHLAEQGLFTRCQTIQKLHARSPYPTGNVAKQTASLGEILVPGLFGLSAAQCVQGRLQAMLLKLDLSIPWD